MRQAQTQQGELRGIHVFWMVFAFFAVVISVDTYFIIGAVKTFPGEKVEKSYVVGLNHNQEMAERAVQQELGWRVQAGLRDGELEVRLMDANAAPVGDLEVSVQYFVAGRGKHPTTIRLSEFAPGRYAAPLSISRPARAEMTIEVRRRNEEGIAFTADKQVRAP